MAVVWPKKSATAEEVVKDLDLTGRHFLVTGANTGIGYETARVLVGRKAHVTMACRNMDKARAARDKILAESPEGKAEVMELDLSDLASVEKFAAEFKKTGRPLHVLLLNAGLYAAPETHTKDGYETTFHVNHLAQFYLTQLLLDNLKASKPSRVVAVSSMAHMQAPMWGPADFEKEELLSPADVSGPMFLMRIYSFTKLCNILFAREFNRRYSGEGVTAYSLHPGAIKTEFARNSPVVSAFMALFGFIVGVSIPRGAATQTFVSTAAGLESLGGEYFDCCHQRATSGAGANMESASKLWETSEKMIASWKSKASK